MPIAALPGNVRLRAFQLGLQSVIGTPVTAVRRFPQTFTPAYDEHWTFPTADTGTLDRAQPPYRLASDINGQAVGPAAFNDMPYYWAALTKSGVTGSGGGADKTYTFAPAYLSQDSFEIFTAEAGDDAECYQLSGGTINQLQLAYPEDLGPIMVTADWYFAAISAGPSFSRANLQVDFAPAWMYAADSAIYINDTAGAIATTQLTNTMHGNTVTINNQLDKKRFQNGSNTRFQLAGYGRGERLMSVAFTFAKSAFDLAEIAHWLNANPVERFLSLKTISPQLITGSSTPYSQELRFAGFWSTRTDGTYATWNTTDVLTCEGFVDQTLAYPFQASVVCGLGSMAAGS